MKRMLDYFKEKKIATLLISSALITTVAVGASVAWLAVSSDVVVNEFVPCEVKEKIVEKFDGELKENVCIQNTGDIDCFVRVAFVFNWLDKDGNVLNIPVSESDIALVMNDPANQIYETGWTKESDGFYYYRYKLRPSAKTENIIFKAYVNEENGNRLDFAIVSQCIQAEPYDAVKEAWGRTPTNDGYLF